MKQRCPRCGAITMTDAHQVTCAWCGTTFDLTSGEKFAPPINSTGGNGGAIGTTTSKVRSRGILTTKPEPNLVMLQAGGALLYSGIFLFAVFVAFSICGMNNSNLEGCGFSVIANFPLIMVLVGVVLAGALFYACRNQSFNLKQTAVTWVWSTIYGFVLLAIEWSALPSIRVSENLFITLFSLQMLVGALLIFFAVPGKSQSQENG